MFLSRSFKGLAPEKINPETSDIRQTYGSISRQDKVFWQTSSKFYHPFAGTWDGYVYKYFRRICLYSSIIKGI